MNTGSPKGRVVSAVAVPEVVGQSEGVAAKALAGAGLVTNVRYVDDVPRKGVVYRENPAAGRDVPNHSVVLLHISLPPRLPPPGQEHEMEMNPLGRLVTDHPDVFVGLYRDEAAVPYVVFGPGANPEEWTDRLKEAADGISYPFAGVGYRTGRCSRTRAGLRALQEEITTDRDWTDNAHLAFGVWVQPETCTVRIESDLLTPADIEALVERYGRAISFDTSEDSHPELLPLAND